MTRRRWLADGHEAAGPPDISEDGAVIDIVMMGTGLALLLAGMVTGLVMAIRQDFLLVPAHARRALTAGGRYSCSEYPTG